MRALRKISAIAGMVLFSLGFPTNSNAVDFGPAKTYPVGTNPAAVVVGDFNGDGKPDIAVANSGSGNVSILLGNGDGTLQAAVNFDAGLSPTSIAVGDFNGDGKLDLAVFQPGSAVNILLGNGNGTFQAPKTLTLTAFSSQLAVADFNGDKISDLAVSEFDSNTKTMTVDIFIGNGDGTFQAAKQTSVPNAVSGSFASADLNSDSKADLAVITSAVILTLLGNGDGTFQTLVALPAPPNTTYDRFAAVGDFNGDQKLDLVLQGRKHASPGCKEFCISLPVLDVYEGTGGGTFGLSRSLFFAPLGGGVAGDFNGDGNSDLLFPFSQVGLGNLLLGGTFEPLPIATPGNLVSGVAADFNGDGLPDVVFIDPVDNVVAVLLNTSPTSGADLGIVHASASPDPVGAGLNLTYTATVLNEGPKGASAVKFTDTLQSGVNFVSASSSQGSCIQSHGVVTCDIGSLASAFKSVVTMVVTPTAAGTITNSMNVAAAEPDLVLANNSVTQSTTVVPIYTLTVAIAGDQSGRSTGWPPDINGSQIDCPGKCSARFLGGTAVSLNFIDSGKAIFTTWGGACAGIDPNGFCTFTMDSDKSVTAKFATGLTLSVTFTGDGTGSVASNPAGINCANAGGTCSAGPFLPSTTYKLAAAASGNSTFGGWSGACTGTDPNACSVTLNSDQTATAKFNLPPDFTLNPTATKLSLKRGGQTSETLAIGAQGGFSGTIVLACSVTGTAPTPPTCGVSPNSVTPGNSATLTVNAVALTAGLTTPLSFERAGGLYAAWLPLGLMGCVLTIGFDKKRRRMWLLCLLVMAATILPAACGSSNPPPPPPPPQNFTVTVTATSGAIQHTTQISVTVQ